MQGLERQQPDHESSSGEATGSRSIVIASTFSIEPIERPFQFWVEALGIPAYIQLAAHGQVMQELLNPHSLFANNAHGINVLLFRIEDWVRDLPAANQLRQHSEHIFRSVGEMVSGIRELRDRSAATLLVCCCPSSSEWSENDKNYLEEIRTTMHEQIAVVNGVYWLDHTDIARLYPMDHLEENELDRIAHIPYTNAYYTALATYLSRRIANLSDAPYKVIVVDCDNTLWKGICGECSPKELQLTGIHTEFQRMLLRQRREGMLLCLCSKNNPEDVDAVFRERTDMPLRAEHFVATRVNWKTKSENLRSLADELDLGLDSFIFIDDNPAELAEVESGCAEVLALQISDEPEAFSDFLNHTWAFDRYSVTNDAKLRSKRYEENRQRDALLANASSFSEFFESLELQVRVEPLEMTHVERVAELVARTNQFNLSGHRRTIGEITAICSCRELESRIIHVSDRFGNYGLTGVLLYRFTPTAATVDTFLLSCRVLGRGVEERVLNQLGRIAQEARVHSIELEYRKTARNQPAREFLTRAFGSFERANPAGATYHVPVDVAIQLTSAWRSGLSPSARSSIPSSTGKRVANVLKTQRLKGLSRIDEIVDAVERRFPWKRQSVKEFIAPRTEHERLLSSIWSEVFALERVGIRDHFFELGGNSLLIVKVLEKLRRAGINLGFRSIYEHPNLSDLAGALRTSSIREAVVPPNLISADSGAIHPEMMPLVNLEQRHIDRLVALVPGAGKNIQDIYPLAPLQEGMLFHHLLNKGAGDPYILVTLLSVPSRAKLESLIAALNRLLDRYDVLRTAIFWEELPKPVQVVLRTVHVPVEELSLDQRADPLTEIRMRMKPERQRMDLHQAPLMRLQVIKDVQEPRWYALLQLHHLICDGKSLELLLVELIAHVNDNARQLPATVPYRNYVAQALLNARVHDTEEFFRGTLKDVEDTTAPFGLLDTSGDGSNLEEARCQLDGSLVKRVRAQAQMLGMSAATLFHAAWGVVVAATSGRDDVVFGTVLLGRLLGNAGAQHTLGMFINTLPLRLQLRNVGVKALVEQTQRQLLDLLDHEYASLAVAQRCSSIKGTAPLFTSLLNYRYGVPMREAGWATRAGLQVLDSKEWTSYPFTLSVDDLDDRIVLTAQTDRRIDPHRIVGYLSTTVSSLVEALESAPDRPALALRLIPPDEWGQVVRSFNETFSPFPQQKLIHELFEEQVEKGPDSTAVIYEGQSLSYSELNSRSNQLAHYLRQHGTRSGEFVPILMCRSLAMVIAQLAILKCGGAYVPVDPALPEDRQAFIIQDCGARCVLVAPEIKRRFMEDALRWIDYSADADVIVSLPRGNLESRRMDPCPAYIIYTSGSTGVPKGVVVAHRGVVRLVINNRYAQIQPSDCIAHSSNPAFDASTFEIWGALLNGARLLIVPARDVLDAERFIDLLRANDVSVLFQTTALFNQQAAARPEGLSGFRYLLFGGEACDANAVRKVLQSGRPQTLLHVYGPTETVTFATWYPVDTVSDDEVTIPIGYPISNTHVYILNSHRQPVPIGTVGEIYIGGPGVAIGYLNRPQLTAERFIADPFSTEPDARLYRTGDLGRWRPDGAIEYLGRNDHQVKIRGFRIELGEIEAQLAKHEQVKEAVVVAREDARGEKRLVAYLTLHDRAGVSAEQLRSHLKGVLPEYMIPRAFTVLGSLPLTPNGKLDRRGLPAPDQDAYASRSYEAPQGEIEQSLAQIWQELLQVERVGRNDDFFELGGHSLLGTRLISRVIDAFHVEIALRTLFEASTLRGLSARIGQEKVDGQRQPPLIARPRPQIIPVSFAQERMWFVEQTGLVGTAYNVPLVLRLTGDLDHRALERSFADIVRRHETLRTRFGMRDGSPYQLIESPDFFEFHRVDLSEVFDVHKMEQKFFEYAKTEQVRQFDLAKGPLFRVTVMRLGAQEHALLIMMHHISVDGWSLGILIRELSALYAAYATGRPVPLPELPVQYADYAIWQRQWLQGKNLRQHLQYWRNKLLGAPPSLQLPTDRPRPVIASYKGAIHLFEIPAPLCAAAEDLARQEGATLFMVLLSAYKVLLARYTGQQDMVVGCPIAGRTNRQTENMIGFFVNMLVLRTDLSGNLSFRTLLKQVKEVTMGAYAHQELPFEKLVMELRPERSLSSQPIFQVALALQNFPNEQLNLAGLHWRRIATPHVTAKFDLALHLYKVRDGLADESDGMAESTRGLHGMFEYSTDLFDAYTVQRMVDHYQMMLETMVTDPDCSIG